MLTLPEANLGLYSSVQPLSPGHLVSKEAITIAHDEGQRPRVTPTSTQVLGSFWKAGFSWASGESISQVRLPVRLRAWPSSDPMRELWIIGHQTNESVAWKDIAWGWGAAQW
jgi:hypothetical protein